MDQETRDEMFAELDAIKARAGEGGEFFLAMAKWTDRMKADAVSRGKTEPRVA